MAINLTLIHKNSRMKVLSIRGIVEIVERGKVCGKEKKCFADFGRSTAVRYSQCIRKEHYL